MFWGKLVEADAVLETFAQVSATLVGFSGVVFAIGRFSQGGLSPAERMGLLHLLIPAAAALFLAMLPMVISTRVEPDALFWRAFNGLIGAVHLFTFGDAMRAVLRREVPDPVAVYLVTIPIGAATIVANFLVVLGFIEQLAVLIYLISVLWFLFISVTQFILLILAHVRENK